MTSLSGPSGYATARSESQTAAPKTMVHVEGRPYFPLLHIDPSNEKSMVDISRTIMDTYYNSSSDEKEVSVTRISGGLTNALFKIDFNPRSVLVRIFGAEGMIDRDEETATFARLCGPPHNSSSVSNSSGEGNKVVHPELDMIGRFANGRIESWIPNMKQSTLTDFDSNLMCGVARSLARLHYGFEVPSYLYRAECREVDGRKERIRVLRPNLWEVIHSWIDELDIALSREEFDDDLLQLFCEAILDKTGVQTEEITSHLREETQWLQSTVQKQHPNATVAFTHNDLCMANILLDQKRESISIIDYEYGSVSYTMYDVANFFSELCGGNDNGVPNLELFPSLERQMEFLSAYVSERSKIVQSQHSNKTAATADDISELISQIKLFQMASNLIWGVWGVLQACGEVNHEAFCKNDARFRLLGEIDADSFDNLRYGMNRLKNYRLCKESLS